MRGTGLVLILALLTLSPARADISLLLVEDNPASRDLTLAIHGRQSLSGEAALRDAVIFVQVKKGVAELRGHVATEALSRQAERIVRDVQGILGVRNYLEIREAKREPAVLNLEPEGPSAARAASPNLALLPEIPLNIPTGPDPTTIRNDPPALPVRPRPAPTLPPLTIEFLTPVFTEEPTRPVPSPAVLVSPMHTPPTASNPTPSPVPTGSVLESLLLEEAFKAIKVVRKGSAVYLHPQPGQGSAVMALARRLQEVPGVEEIVLVPMGR